MVRLLFSLVAIGTICGALLVGTHALTRSDIERNREARARALMATMLDEELGQHVDVQAAVFGQCDECLRHTPAL